MADAARQAEVLRDLLAEARDKLKLDIAFELWDGSRVPPGAPDGALAIVIADPGAIARLTRRPKLDTLLRLHLAGRLDLKGGDIFELAARRPEGKVGRMARAIETGKVWRALRSFAAAPGGEPLIDFAGPGEGRRRDGSEASNKANIAHHYDVSNDFYRLFLDQEMVYSCGYFDGWHEDIDKAQHDKLEMICRKLRLRPGDRFLDIGSGWGALLCHAVRHHGVIGTGVTLSEEQAAFARAKAERLGIADRVTIRLEDYAKLDARFDKIASIGMFEHVGLDNHDRYFAAVHRLLEPRGVYLHHAIVRRAKRDDKAFRRQKPEYKAMTRYIFPGGEVDHIGMTVKNLEVAGFEVHDVEQWREHYAQTTELWARRLMARRAEAVAEVGEVVTRAWIAYLAGVSLAFRRGTLSICQTVATRRTRGPSGLPPTRRDLYR